MRAVTKSRLAVWLLVGLTIPWQLGGKQPVAILVDFLLVALAAFLLLRSFEFRGWKSSIAAWLPLGLLLWAIMSLSWSVNRYQSVIWIEVLILGIAMYWLVGSIALDSDLRSQWLSGYSLVATLSGLWGMVIYLTQSYDRLTSSFYLANPAAAFLLPALLICLWRYVKFGNKLSAICLPVLASSFVLTDSRSAFIVAGLAVLVCAGVRMPTKSWLRVGAVVIVTLLLVVSSNLVRAHAYHNSVSLQGTRFELAATGETTSFRDRWNYLISALDIWKAYPILGTGAGTYGIVHPEYQIRVISAATEAHNYYVQTVSELGVGGLLFLGLLVIALVAQIVKRYRNRTGMALAVILVAMIVHFALDIDAIYPAIMVVLGGLAGLVVAPAQSKGVLPRQLIIALGISLIVLVPAYAGFRSYQWSSLGLADQTAGDYNSALNDYTHAHGYLTYDPVVLTAEGIEYFTLAPLSPNLKNIYYGNAIKLAKQAEMLDPDDSQHLFLQARVDFKLSKDQEAIALYNRAITLDRFNHPEYYADLADLYFIDDKPAQVISTADAVLNQYPPSVVANRSVQPDLFLNLSLLYYFRGAVEATSQPAKAIKDEQMAVSLNPDNAVAKYVLASLGH
ncbi:MAG: O-antigen ligase family protein [Candidatus Saccharimonadia bacterium]